MNMLFLETGLERQAIPKSDRRYDHIARVLKKKAGDALVAGVRGESTGSATVDSIDDKYITIAYRALAVPPKLYPITLLLGFPRPIQGGRIFKDICSLGVERILLCGTALGEKSYIESNFFKNREYEAALIEGAEQAGNPRLPQVASFWTLDRALGAIDGGTGDVLPECSQRWALDPYRSQTRFGAAELDRNIPLILAVGSERGWTPSELDSMAGCGFCFAKLGERILKSETACTVAVGIALAKLGYL